MITVLDNVFCLFGKNSVYALYVNYEGYLRHAYYGVRISEKDILYLISNVINKLEPKRGDLNADMAFDVMPSEYGFYARGDYREPSFIAERTDGASMSRLRYVSHRVYDGVIQFNGMPQARDGGQTLEITLRDDFSDAQINLNYTVYDDSDTVVRNAVITNCGSLPLRLKKAFSFCVDLPACDYDVISLYGGWANERNVSRTSLGRNVTRIQSLRGTSSHQTSPFIAVLDKNCLEETGYCYGFQLVYSGSFAMTAETTSNGVRVQGGIQDVNFCWTLNGGESFVTPQAVMCYSANGIGGMSRSFSDFLRAHLINPAFVNKRRPIVVNNWEATYWDFDNDKLFAIIDETAAIGADTFVLDDGWFGCRNDDTSGLGDWIVNTDKLQGGLNAIINRCKQNGLKFGLWFEPESVSENSDLYRAHPDFAVGKPDCGYARWRNQLVLDFTRRDVVDYIYDSVSKIISYYDISYVKWDFNRSVTEFYSSTLDSDRQGEFAHRYILGVYDLAERLTKAFPDVLFEGCAGGGGRFDAGMLYYFPQIWTSDNTDAIDRTKIQWGASMCYPISALSCHVSAVPNHQTGRVTPFDTRGAVASLGVTGYELDLSKLSFAEKQSAKEQTENYKQIEELILQGDLYRLSNPFLSDCFSQMLLSKDKNKAYVVAVQIHGRACGKTLKLAGLNPDKQYRIDSLGIQASGKALSFIGVPLPNLGEYESVTFTVNEVK